MSISRPIHYTDEATIELLESELAAAQQRVAELEAELHPHTFCLNCGAKELCNLDTQETSGDPNWPGSPCMFDPTPRQLFDCVTVQRKKIAELEEWGERAREAQDDFRDPVLNQRGALAENGMDSQQVNDVLAEFDAIIPNSTPDSLSEIVKAKNAVVEAARGVKADLKMTHDTTGFVSVDLLIWAYDTLQAAQEQK